MVKKMVKKMVKTKNKSKDKIENKTMDKTMDKTNLGEKSLSEKRVKAKINKTILQNIFFNEMLDHFRIHVFPAMLRNKSVLSTNFKEVSEYINFIDALYGKKGKALELLNDYFKKNFNNADKWVQKMVQENNLKTVINILVPLVEEDVREERLNLVNFFEEYYFLFLYPNFFEVWLEELDDETINKLIEKYGLQHLSYI